MEQNERPDRLRPLRPGDRVIRVGRRRPRRRLRIVPDIPEVIRFLREMAGQTPLVPAVLALVLLWLLSSWGVYVAERGVNEQISSYGYALWWTFTAIQTQGANSPGPITSLGMLIGSISSILGTVGFFGVIVGTLYAYFMSPRRRPFRIIVETLQYNLGQLENLSTEELEVLRDTLVQIVNGRIQELKRHVSDQ